MDVAPTRSPSPHRSASPSPAQASPPSSSVDRAALEQLVLQQLFNASRPLTPSPPPALLPMDTVAALYERLVVRRDFSTVDADQQTLIDALRDCSRHGAVRGAFSLDNCSLGKVLHVLCQVWRERSTRNYDARLLVEATTLCGDLIERKRHFKLETCGVLMFHLGELITYSALQPLCERLICDHLEPRFRAEVRAQLHLPLRGPEVLFGLVSTLRAAEGRVVAGPDGISPRTAADMLVTTVHMLLLRQPDLLTRCNSSTLGLLARHAAHYLLRLSALPAAWRTTSAAEERERAVAQLLRRCIDEVSMPGPRDIDAANGLAAPGLGGHLRHAVPCYLDWLAGQTRSVQTRFALRDAEAAIACVEGWTKPLPAAAVPSVPEAAPAPVPAGRRQGATPVTRLARFFQAVERLPEDGRGARRVRDQALAAADALIVSLQLGWTQPALATQVRVLLGMDTLYRHLDAANPMGSQPYAASLSSLRGFMEAQLSGLRDASGAPLLGPSPPLQAGLHSWQRMLLSQLVEQPAATAAV
jgi:hypothetical protein